MSSASNSGLVELKTELCHFWKVRDIKFTPTILIFKGRKRRAVSGNDGTDLSYTAHNNNGGWGTAIAATDATTSTTTQATTTKMTSAESTSPTQKTYPTRGITHTSTIAPSEKTLFISF